MPGPALTDALNATTPSALRAASWDVLVIGSGAAGGAAACLLAEAGLRVLVLEAGTALSPVNISSTEVFTDTPRPDSTRQPIQSQCYAWHLQPEGYVDDIDCPYTTPLGRPFIWVRARQLGGRLAVPGHGRQYYRLSPKDFAPTDGLSPPWPFSADELDPWYTTVERRLGLAGMHDDVAWLPNSELSRVLEPTPDETALQRVIAGRWPNARPILSRFGSPFDWLEAAAVTGRLLVRTGAIARKIEVDQYGRVSGVIWIDREDGTQHRARASLVFLCASALESTRLLLLSRSGRYPNGLGASSGVLGRYLMDHLKTQVHGQGPPLLLETPPELGRCVFLPRFDARDLPTPEGRGFGVQLYQIPGGPERSYFGAGCFAEMLPRFENRVTLDSEQRDAWDIPVLRIDCVHNDADVACARAQLAALRTLVDATGLTLTLAEEPAPPGISLHECGTARMGNDAGNSVLNPYNQCWDAKGLYVTDAACFPSQGAQNPTLTILALTARACDHAMHVAKDREIQKAPLQYAT